MKMTSYAPRRSLYGRLSGFSRQSAGRESSGENCRQLFPKSRADALALSAGARILPPLPCRETCMRVVRVCAKETRRWSSGSAAPILMCESLGTITAITGPVASQHTIRVRGHFAVSHALFIHASRKSCKGFPLGASDASAAVTVHGIALEIRRQFPRELRMPLVPREVQLTFSIIKSTSPRPMVMWYFLYEG